MGQKIESGQNQGMLPVERERRSERSSGDGILNYVGRHFPKQLINPFLIAALAIGSSGCGKFPNISGEADSIGEPPIVNVVDIGEPIEGPIIPVEMVALTEESRKPTVTAPSWLPPTLEQARVTASGGQTPENLQGFDQVVREGLDRIGGINIADIEFYSTGFGDEYRWAMVPKNTRGEVIWAKDKNNGAFMEQPVYYQLKEFTDENKQKFNAYVVDTENVDYEIIPNSQGAEIIWAGSEDNLPVLAKEPLVLGGDPETYTTYWNIKKGEWQSVHGVVVVDGIFKEIKDGALMDYKAPDWISTKFDETAIYNKTAEGMLQISDSLYTAIYKEGEWQFNPTFQTSFEPKFLEATLEKYYRKEDTPDSTEEALRLLKSKPGYESKVTFASFQGKVPFPSSFRIFSLFTGAEYISMEGQPSVQPGDLGLVGVLINPVFPEGMPVFLGVQRGDDFIPVGNVFNRVNNESIQIDNTNIDNIFELGNELVQSFIMYACRNGDLKVPVWPFGEVNDLPNQLVINPNGYLAKYTSKVAKEGHSGRRDLDNMMKEVFDEMNTSKGGDVAFYTFNIRIFDW